MSVSFQLFKNTKGWSLTTDNRYDLTNWSIEYSPQGIRCRPMPLDFIYMAFGAVLFLGLAIFILILAINPRFLVKTQPNQKEPLSAQLSPANYQAPVRSKYQQDVATPAEIERRTREMKDRLMKDMTPEQRERFERNLEESAQQRDLEREQSRAKMDRRLGMLVWIGRFFAAIGVVVFGFIGGVLCLPRALLFFRDKIEISVHQNQLVLTRPRLLGGVGQRLFPLNSLGRVSAYAKLHRGGRYAPRYVAWVVQISSRHPDIFPLQFEVEHLDAGASLETPSSRVKRFVRSLRSMTGLKTAT